MTEEEFANPDWNNKNRVHDWKNYVREELKVMWPSFTLEQRRVIAENMDNIASDEGWD